MAAATTTITTTIFSTDENQLIDECFDFIKSVIREAGEYVKEGFSKANDDLGIEEKEDNWDMVTEYDKKTETFLINSIKTQYPQHK